MREEPHHYTTNSGNTIYSRKLGRKDQTRMNATTNEGEQNSLEKANESTEKVGNLTLVTKDGRVIVETNHG